MEFRDIKANEIDLRVGTVTTKGYTLLLYKDARVDMAMLDETVGQMNWQRDHKEVKGNLYCGIGIWDNDKQLWIWKWDCGAESFSDKEKGEASDSFKRAGFNWGIGRELYTAPFIWIPCEAPDKKLPQEEANRIKKLYISKLVISNKQIVSLEINDGKQVVFSFPKAQGGTKKTEGKHDSRFNHTGAAILSDTPTTEENSIYAIKEILASDHLDVYTRLENCKLNLSNVAAAFGVDLWNLSLEDIVCAIEYKEKDNEKAN